MMRRPARRAGRPWQGARTVYIQGMTQAQFYGGNFLLALPGMEDMRFDHSVVALCVHDGDGALGITVGEEMDGLGLRELLGSFDIDGSKVPDTPVLRGGPVEPRRGFVLHSLDWAGQDMVQVNQQWGLSGSLDILKAIAQQRGPSRYLVALGYAGWGPGQLEQEVSGNSWLTVPADRGILFQVATNDKLTAAGKQLGIDIDLLTAQAGHA